MIDLSSISFSQLLSIKERLSTRYNGAPNKALFEQLCNVQDAINTKEPTAQRSFKSFWVWFGAMRTIRLS